MLNVFPCKIVSLPFMHTVYLESKSYQTSVLSVVFCFSICGSQPPRCFQWACLLVLTLSFPTLFQGWTGWLMENDRNDAGLILRVAHKRHCGVWFCLACLALFPFLSFFLSLPGLLTLGLVSSMSGGHLAAVWSSLCGEELRAPATTMWVSLFGSRYPSPRQT